jgi:hypothetical protein
MIETILLLSGLVMLIVSGYLEIANRSFGRLHGAYLAKKVIGTQKLNLVWYSALLVALMSGFTLWVFEITVFPGFALMLSISIVVMLMASVAINQERFNPNRVKPEAIAEAYFEAVKNAPPEEGIDYITQYIRNPKWGAPTSDLQLFLDYVGHRDDQFGLIARKRLQELK